MRGCGGVHKGTLARPGTYGAGDSAVEAVIKDATPEEEAKAKEVRVGLSIRYLSTNGYDASEAMEVRAVENSVDCWCSVNNQALTN